MVSDQAAEVTGQILILAGGLVVRFDRPTAGFVGYRDHTSAPPWTLPELHAMVTGGR